MLGKTVLFFFLYQQMNLDMDIATVFFLTTSDQVIKWLNYDQVDGWFYSKLVTNMTNEIQIIALSSLVGGLEHLDDFSSWEWKIIPTDDSSIIFQRGRRTNHQLDIIKIPIRSY